MITEQDDAEKYLLARAQEMSRINVSTWPVPMTPDDKRRRDNAIELLTVWHLRAIVHQPVPLLLSFIPSDEWPQIEAKLRAANSLKDLNEFSTSPMGK